VVYYQKRGTKSKKKVTLGGRCGLGLNRTTTWEFKEQRKVDPRTRASRSGGRWINRKKSRNPIAFGRWEVLVNPCGKEKKTTAHERKRGRSREKNVRRKPAGTGKRMKGFLTVMMP